MPSKPPRISLSWLPSAAKLEMDFLDSSFFQSRDPYKHLPAPTEVRDLSKQPKPQPDPVKFEELGLIVKFGPHVTVEEALCIWAIRGLLRNGVPVPEVYGWRVDGSEVFIYMELIEGDTLKDRWDGLGDDDKISICNQLQKITTSFRGLEQDPEDMFIGVGPCLSSVDTD